MAVGVFPSGKTRQGIVKWKDVESRAVVCGGSHRNVEGPRIGGIGIDGVANAEHGGVRKVGVDDVSYGAIVVGGVL